MERLIARSVLQQRLLVFVAIIGLSAIAFPATSRGAVEPVPSIEFLNPSSFAEAGDAGIIVSDRQPGRPNAGKATYRLSAWTRNAPANAGVEFELLAGGVSLDTFDGVRKVGSDTFEYRWNISDTLPDGPYTVRATLFASNNAVDSVDQAVTITRLADRAELVYPNTEESSFPSDGTFGTYRPLAAELPGEGSAQREKPVGNIDANHTKGTDVSGGTTRVRAFYTISKPGTKPNWIVCGTEATPGHPTLDSAANDGVRCTLKEASHQLNVTAVAVLANSSPGTYDPVANAAGDATRVLKSYAQVPTKFDVPTGDGGIAAATNDGFECFTVLTELSDQVGREIVGANIDVHATGPSDKLRFDTGLGSEAPAKQADRNHQLQEPAYNCLATAGGDTQSEHQVLGGPDMKHIESDADGTDDSGRWGFRFKVADGQVSTDRFTVNFTAYVDEGDDGCRVNNDELTGDELFRSGAVGLGVVPGAAASPTIVPKQPCGAARPSRRSLTLESSQAAVKRGGSVRFYGAISSVKSCKQSQIVNLQMRAPGGKFRAIAAGRTADNGTYEFRKVPINRTRDYRAATPKTSRCTAAKSGIVKVKAGQQ